MCARPWVESSLQKEEKEEEKKKRKRKEEERRNIWRRRRIHIRYLDIDGSYMCVYINKTASGSLFSVTIME